MHLPDRLVSLIVVASTTAGTFNRVSSPRLPLGPISNAVMHASRNYLWHDGNRSLMECICFSCGTFKVPVRDILHFGRYGDRKASCIGLSHRRQPASGAKSGAWIFSRRTDAQNGGDRRCGCRFLFVFSPANGKKGASFSHDIIVLDIVILSGGRTMDRGLFARWTHLFPW